MKTFITATAMLMLFMPIASACPDYIMSCYAAGKKQTQTTCITYRDSYGSLVTTCTSN